MSVSRIKLVERVPPDYHRLFMFFGEDNFRAFICVDGSQEMALGSIGFWSNENARNWVNWSHETVQVIRAELQVLENGEQMPPTF